MSWIGASVAAGLVEIGSGLVGLAVFEGPFSMHRSTHRHRHRHRHRQTSEASLRN